MSRAKKMYESSPEMKRDESDGKMKVSKAEKKSAQVNAGTDGMPMKEEGMPASARHAAERRDMYNRHETEHSMQDNGAGGDKKEMNSRHAKEMTDMQKRHEKETTKGSGGGQEKIGKVTKE